MQIQEDLPVNRKGHDKIKDLRTSAMSIALEKIASSYETLGL